MFQRLRTLAEVATFFGVSHPQLRHILYRIPPTRRYVQYGVPKKSGGVRTIVAPIAQLKAIQRALCLQLDGMFQAKPGVQGFVRGRSIVSNAEIHVGARVLLNIDLRDFFPTINFGRVRGVFLNKPFECSPAVATILAQVCCHDGKLPQGAPTSPIISNLICRRMDTELQRLASEYQCRYSRYADDISFSTRRAQIPPQLACLNADGVWAVGEILGEIIHRHQFVINAEKVRLRRKHERQVVTGLKVNRVPNVSRKILSRIRAMLYAWETHGLAAAQEEFQRRFASNKHRAPLRGPRSFRLALKGYIEFVGMVRGKNSPVFLRLGRELRALDGSLTENWDLDTFEERIQRAMCVIEYFQGGQEDTTWTQGTCFGLNGFGTVTCEHTLPTNAVHLANTRVYKVSSRLRRYPISVVSRSRDLDVAIILSELPDLHQLEAAFVEPLVGDTVIIAGFPNHAPGASGTFVRAHVTGHREFNGVRRYLVDLPIVTGTSGGPVMNINGQVVGIAVEGIASAEEAANQEFAFLPVSVVRQLQSSNTGL